MIVVGLELNVAVLALCWLWEYCVQHYERLTRASLDTLTATADVVLELDSGHGCVRTEFRNG